MKLLTLSLALVLLQLCIFGQIKKPQPRPTKIPFAQSRQAVVVTTKDWNDTQGEGRLYERPGAGAKWTQRGDPFPVVVGRAGLAWERDSAPVKTVQFKVEGDGKSPAGMFPLTFAFGTSVNPCR